MTIQAAIKIEALTKRYGASTKLALDDLSVSINPGEVYGFLGPNGAGKSTTIRLLMNFLQPTRGTAKILGYDIVKDSVAIKQSVGYLAGDFSVYPKMNGKQYLQYLNELQGSGGMSYVNALAKRLNADLDKPLGELSRGNRQKIGIIQALMHQPKVLILDEPTSGLDPLMQEEFYKLINEAKQLGTAVFMSSHILSEVQRICSRVGIVREGKLVGERVIADLVSEAAQTFNITFADTVPLSELKRIKGVKIQNSHGSTVTIHMKGKLSGLFAVLAKHDVSAIAARNLDLEEMFIHFYQNKGARQ